MNAIRNMKIGAKLACGFATLTLLMLLLAAVSLIRISAIADAIGVQDKIQETKLAPVYAMREALAQTGLAARNAYVFKNDADAEKELAIVDTQKAIYLDALKKLAPVLAGDVRFEKVKSGLLQMAEELKKPRLYREAQKMTEFGDFLVNECSPLRRQIVLDIDVLLRGIEQEDAVASSAAQVQYHQALIFIVALAIAAVVASIAIAALITRSLLRQLGGEPAYAVEIAGKIAGGDLATRIDVGVNDNSSLLHAIKTMRDNLADIVREVRVGTDTIAMSSAEIAHGNHDLSVRTEQQAGSLERTSSAMDQLMSTVNQNAENAQQASQLAGTASDIASKGGAVVQQVVDTMGGISDSSRRIVDIIAVIDGIAFQTNILALNAAVEAARAGEQGRGFAVVASEVRNLAHRSASAAKEIKKLIDDSVSKVDSGGLLVQQAGATMQQVVASVQRVTEVVVEISTASNEQSIGIGEIGRAVTEMDEATQQNAALVEEASAAAQSLRDQAEKLSGLVGMFILNEQPQGLNSLTYAEQRAIAMGTPPVEPGFAPTAKPLRLLSNGRS